MDLPVILGLLHWQILSHKHTNSGLHFHADPKLQHSSVFPRTSKVSFWLSSSAFWCLGRESSKIQRSSHCGIFLRYGFPPAWSLSEALGTFTVCSHFWTSHSVFFCSRACAAVAILFAPARKTPLNFYTLTSQHIQLHRNHYNETNACTQYCCIFTLSACIYDVMTIELLQKTTTKMSMLQCTSNFWAVICHSPQLSSLRSNNHQTCWSLLDCPQDTLDRHFTEFHEMSEYN